MNDPRYPIGRFVARDRTSTAEERETAARVLEGHPARVRAIVADLPDDRLDASYRDGGWSVRQLVHHLADSHLNAYTRFRLALTEEHPTIRPYDQDRWAELPDARSAPVEESLALLEGLHGRWVRLLRALGPEDFRRPLRHPEIGDVTLDFLLEMYAWHARHHEAHLAAAGER
jgi:uncharacterized damage-inducible protein DinB